MDFIDPAIDLFKIDLLILNEMASPSEVTSRFVEYVSEIATRPHSLTVDEYDDLLTGLPAVSEYLKNFIESQKQKVVAAASPEVCTSFEYQGTRAYHEDRKLCCRSEYTPSYLGGRSIPFRLYVVFDGHRDVDVAAFLADEFCDSLKKCLEIYDTPSEAIRSCFQYLDTKIYDRELTGGSTATGALIIKDVCYVFNSGDSRTMIFGDVDTVITCDHKPQTERDRIKGTGFDVVAGRICTPGSPRGTGLAVSRGLGDIKYKMIGGYFDPLAGAVCCVPDVTVCEIPENSKVYIILASDGYWDVFSPGQVLETLGDDPVAKIDTLFDQIEDHPEIRDNVTVVFTKI